jgi:hypothetical protein
MIFIKVSVKFIIQVGNDTNRKRQSQANNIDQDKKDIPGKVTERNNQVVLNHRAWRNDQNSKTKQLKTRI